MIAYMFQDLIHAVPSLDVEKLPESLDTEQEYAAIVIDNESLKLRNRKLTNEIEKLTTMNKTMVRIYSFIYFLPRPSRGDDITFDFLL